MKLAFTKKFLKQIEKIYSQKLKEQVAGIISDAEQADSISEIEGIKKLSGFRFYYRIRIGDYRIGLYLNKDVLEFAAFDHRKDIYRYFP
jgi:mRNA interferase RelE/StbE